MHASGAVAQMCRNVCYVATLFAMSAQVDCDLVHLRPMRSILFTTLPALVLSLRVAPTLPRTRIPLMMAEPVPVTEDWVTTDTGLQYVDEKVGDGETPSSGDVVKVAYTGWIEATGSEFDSSLGRAPIAFAVGTGRVIPGWDQGILSMKVGGRRRLSIPSELGYGENGAGDAIPPNSRLQFQCELIGVESGAGAFFATFPGGLPNIILVTLLALSFIPYFLPEKPEFWQ